MIFSKTLYSQGYDGYSLNSSEFHGIKEVRINLENNSSRDRDNYKCYISIVGVDYKNYEIERSFPSSDLRPLDTWRNSFIRLELTNH